MGYYKLYRQKPEGKAVRGVIYSHIGGIQKRVSESLENLDFLIPALTYRVQVTKSPHFKRLLPLVCNVPNRAGIRIHRGSKPEHSRGCILVAPDVEKALTQELLEQQKRHEEIRIEIIDFRPGD